MADDVKTQTEAAPTAQIEAGRSSVPAQQGASGGTITDGGNAPRDGEVLPPSSGRKRKILVGVLLAGLLGGGYYGYGWYTEGRFMVSTDDAYIKADMSTLAAKVPGYVAGVAVSDNAQVKEGDILVTIDDGDYQLAVRTAQDKIATQDAAVARIGKQVLAQRSSVDQARAQLSAQETELVRASADLERAETLAKSDFGTKARLDQSRADRDRAVANVTSAQAAIATAEAQISVLEAQKIEAERTRGELLTSLEKAKRDLEFTKVRAPFDGVVGNRVAQPGQYVQAGTRLLALVPLGSAYIEANFKETQLGRLKAGEPVNITVDAISGRTVKGVVEGIAPASGSQFSLLPPENATGNFTKIVQRVPVRISVPKDLAEQGVLRPGLSVVVTVDTREHASPNGSALAQSR